MMQSTETGTSVPSNVDCDGKPAEVSSPLRAALRDGRRRSWDGSSFCELGDVGGHVLGVGGQHQSFLLSVPSLQLLLYLTAWSAAQHPKHPDRLGRCSAHVRWRIGGAADERCVRLCRRLSDCFIVGKQAEVSDMRDPTFRVLGRVEVDTTEGPVTPSGRTARTVLALLIIQANHMVPYDRLAHAIWGDELPRTWLRTLQTHVSHLRQLVAPIEITRLGDAYQLDVEAELIDAVQFERLGERAHRELLGGQPEATRRLCLEALELWRGPSFGDVADTEVLQLEVLRLEEIRMTVIELCFAADLQLGRHQEVVGALEAAARQFPYRERFRRDLIRALTRCGRRTEAIEATRLYGEMLREVAGLDPVDEIAVLEDEIRVAGPGQTSQ